MLALVRGKYRARLACDAADLARAQSLRHRSFLAQRGLAQGLGRDADEFDPLCDHMLVEDCASGQLVCCYRLMAFAGGQTIATSYAAQVYGLTALDAFPGAKLELGRFCLDPDWHDPDILRLAWGAMTQIVDSTQVRLLFGCSSFTGAEWQPHTKALALLCGHLAPQAWQPAEKASERFRFASALPAHDFDLREALQSLPPLLRTYLAMGGWVSDHAVIDRQLDTLHVFTAVEIAKIPPARARALRAIAE